jgi:hypothetical protein
VLISSIRADRPVGYHPVGAHDHEQAGDGGGIPAAGKSPVDLARSMMYKTNTMEPSKQCIHQSFEPESCKTCLRLERLAIERLARDHTSACSKCGEPYLPTRLDNRRCVRCQADHGRGGRMRDKQEMKKIGRRMP